MSLSISITSGQGCTGSLGVTNLNPNAPYNIILNLSNADVVDQNNPTSRFSGQVMVHLAEALVDPITAIIFGRLLQPFPFGAFHLSFLSNATVFPAPNQWLTLYADSEFSPIFNN